VAGKGTQHPSAPSGPTPLANDRTIWLFALGYFLAYAPYSALTKALSEGAVGPVRTGLEILPLTLFSLMVGMYAVLFATGWWKEARGKLTLGPITLPAPRKRTLLSGIATAAVIVTATLAYSFEGVSIVLMMLLMRGGVLVMAPVIDLNSQRRVPWTSWSALILCLASLLVATSHRADLRLSMPAMACIVVYLGAYFVRLHFMSRLAKNESKSDARAYFVEEQMTAGPVALGLAIILALALPKDIGAGEQLRSGLVDVIGSSQRWVVVLVGLFSLGTGVFGTLVLLDARENSFTVPVNRAASVLAGVAATFALNGLVRGARVDLGELAGAALVILAIALLAWPMRYKHRTLVGWAPRLPPEK
jgi:hypothetical protein